MAQQVLLWNGMTFNVNNSNCSLQLSQTAAGLLHCVIICDITQQDMEFPIETITSDDNVPEGRICLNLTTDIDKPGSSGRMSSGGSSSSLVMNFAFKVSGLKKDLGS